MDISSIVSFKNTAVRYFCFIIVTGIVSAIVANSFAVDKFGAAFHWPEYPGQITSARYPGYHDHHALNAVSWNPAQEEKNFWQGWMNQRNYIKESSLARWCGADSAAREISLKTLDGRVSLTPTPVSGLSGLRDSLLYHSEQSLEIKPGITLLQDHQVDVPVFEIEAEIMPEMAREVGFQIRSGEAGAVAVIGYDAVTERLYIDSHHARHRQFAGFLPSKHETQVKLNSGVLKLRILVDMSSVTVFSGVGDVLLTGQIFPQLSDTGMKLFSYGGASVLKKISVWSVHSIWEHSHLIF
ncbi:GH32 C-terminal domain-containing protein [Vibrio quintilis]|uniref:Levanase n=1 Tax=Vibrio quintilis TaxID=1117707 RepID=A0A1M7YR49_9VIBR|nr:GH32 C-terminal domain-containing protein [Vibrio quintilis]SHO55088.1 Levanase precursor [Vibrio quintilis]